MFDAAKIAAWSALLLSSIAAHAENIVDAQLRAAARAGDLAAVTNLLQAGADPTRSDALLAAVSAGQRRAADLLLERGADPNAWAAGRDRLPDGAAASAVLIAAKRGDREMLLDLKRRGADLDAESTSLDSTGETPLIVAARQRDLAAVRMLLECGADANHRSRNGDTALRESIRMKPDDGDFVSVLVQKGADPDVKVDGGKSVRDLVYAFGPSTARDAIDRFRPPPAYAHPEDTFRISAVLGLKSRCDELIPDYAARTSTTYQAWRSNRGAAIAAIEASEDYKTLQAYNQAMLHEARTQNDPEQQDQLAKIREACESQLIDEFRGIQTALFAKPAPLPAPVILTAPAAVQTVTTNVVIKRAPAAQGGGMMSHPTPQ